MKKPSKGSIFQAKKIYQSITGYNVNYWPKSSLKNLAYYLDNIKKQERKKSRQLFKKVDPF